MLERLEKINPADLTINYTLHRSSVVLPGILVRLLTLAVLFRLNSPGKWRLALEQKLLPEPIRHAHRLANHARALGLPGATIR